MSKHFQRLLRQRDDARRRRRKATRRYRAKHRREVEAAEARERKRQQKEVEEMLAHVGANKRILSHRPRIYVPSGQLPRIVIPK